MKKNFKQSILLSGLVVGLLGMTGQAFAHLPPGGVNIDFESGTNTPSMAVGPLPGSVFPAFGNSYIEDGVVHSAIGFGIAPGTPVGNGGGGSHVHGEPGGGGTVSVILRDSGGAFFQLVDGDAFSIGGLDVHSMNFALAGGGFSTMTLRGYTSSDLSTFHDVTLSDDGSGNPDGNGIFDADPISAGGHLHLEEVDEFGSIYLFEYFFDSLGRGNDGSLNPNLINLVFRIDNVEFGPEVAAVPVPAAVYLFGTALMGLLGMGRKRSDSAIAA